MAQPPLERALVRETGDGGRVLFPWGLAHRGYRVDEATAAKGVRAASWLLAATVAVGTWTAHRLEPLLEPESAVDPWEVLVWPAAVLAVTILAYAWRVSRLIEGCAESDLRVSQEERLREAAEMAGPGKVAAIGAATIGLGGLAAWIAPHTAWIGGLAVACGAGLLVWSRALARARARPPGPEGMG